MKEIKKLDDLMTDVQVEKIVLTCDDASDVPQVEIDEFGQLVIMVDPEKWKIEITKTEVY